MAGGLSARGGGSHERRRGDLPQSVVFEVARRARDPRGEGCRRRRRPLPRYAARSRHARADPRCNRRRTAGTRAHRRPEVQGGRAHAPRRRVARTGDQHVARASGSDAASGRVRRQEGCDRPSGGTRARAVALMARWADVEREAPELAARAREIFDANKHKAIATIRADGSPRISGTEAEFWDGDVWWGSMPDSRKGDD